MANNKTIITITHPESAADMKHLLKKEQNDPKAVVNGLIAYLSGVAGGNRLAQIDIQVAEGTAVAASGTLTLSGCVAGDSATINGVAFACVASGATGNQFNVGGTDTISAANLAAKINASSTANVKDVVTASSSGPVVTVSTSRKGSHGNMFTLVGSTHITASGAALTGGVESPPAPQSHGL